MEGCRWGSTNPGMMQWSLNVSSISWLCDSSHGRMVSNVPTSTIRPPRTATASATGSEGSMVRTVRATNTVMSAMQAPHAVGDGSAPDASVGLVYCPQGDWLASSSSRRRP